MFSALATIVSRGKDGRIGCPVERNLEIVLTSHVQFLFILGQCADHCKQNLSLERNVGVTECPRSLNARKTLAVAIFPKGRGFKMECLNINSLT